MLAKKTERKKCFVVGPIGADDSEDRIHADWLLEEIIQPVFAEHFKEFDVTRADKISDPGRIDAQVISSLLESELVIADLTTLNPNAFYEIGIRHTVQKPIIHMHLEGERIPFDIASFRSIKFDRKRPRDLRAARELLKASVTAALDEGHEVDNPVTFARGRVEFDKTATPAEKVVQEQLEAIAHRIETLERPSRTTKRGYIRVEGRETETGRWLPGPGSNSADFEITSGIWDGQDMVADIEAILSRVAPDLRYRIASGGKSKVIVKVYGISNSSDVMSDIERFIRQFGFDLVYIDL